MEYREFRVLVYLILFICVNINLLRMRKKYIFVGKLLCMGYLL